MIQQRPFKLNSKSHFLLCCQAIFASSRCFFLCFCLNRNSYIIHCPPGVIIIIIKGTCLPLLPDEKSSNPPTTHDGVSDSPSRRGADHLSRGAEATLALLNMRTRPLRIVDSIWKRDSSFSFCADGCHKPFLF